MYKRHILLTHKLILVKQINCTCMLKIEVKSLKLLLQNVWYIIRCSACDAEK